MRKISVSIALLLILICVGLVSAAVYWTATQTFSQTIKNVKTGTFGSLKHSTIFLEDVNEGESATFNAAGSFFLDDALIQNISGAKETATLSVKFNNPSHMKRYYSTYRLNVIASAVPGGSSITAGDTVLTVDLTTTTDSVDLDSDGEWYFDYEVSVTAKKVTEDTIANAKFTFKAT